ncbi:thioesterase superfamily protein [Colletotrichum truncatum]|uniref:Thioesterase superfamily protein n=1 Tax=Colletotrichum truncatum TaxID=5467 RepID=A0ACC3Z1J7_COLTU|nr:thioesterase superfamily protein [Colletotrichum truncatum]KAF6788870.1 thioesterase superfamily protein [Colletotrichum truncatum]
MVDSTSWPDQIAYFQAIPWCAKVLSEPGIITMPPITRQFDPETRNSEFLGVTLHSQATIPFFVGCFHVPDGNNTQCSATDERPFEKRFVTKIRFFLALNHGLSTVSKDWVHGGAIASIFDECLGSVGFVNKMHGFLDPLPQVTQTLKLTYVRPVLTGSVISVTSRLARFEGSKNFVVEAEMADEKGVVLATAEATFVPLEKRRKLTEKL